MYSFKEVVARLVIVANVVIIVETRARYIYQPGPFIECQKYELPCGGRTEGSCNDYCEENGFARGSCDGHCCLCSARTYGLLQPVSPMQLSVNSGGSTPAIFTILSMMRKPIINSQTSITQSPNTLANQAGGSGHVPKPKRSASLSQDSPIQNQLHEEKFEQRRKPTRVEEAKKNPNEDICLTPGCIKTAASILENIKEDVNPCDDFYEFTCGNFQKDTRIPDDKGAVTLMGSINDKLTEQLRELLESPSREKNLPGSAILAKKLYDSCMDTERQEVSGVEPLKNLFTKLGGWPVLETAWDSTSWTWETTVAKLRKTGLVTDYLLKISVVPDLKNPKLRTLHIGEPLLSFTREQLHHPHFIQAYRQFQQNVAKLLGSDGTQVSKDFHDVFEFEKKLANISLPRELSRAHPLNFYHPTPISQLQERYSKVEWLPYIRNLLPSGIEIDENELVNVHEPDQLTRLVQLISTTEKRTLANYLMWRTASALLPYLNEEAIRIQQGFVGSLSGKRQRKPRWRECIDIVTKTLGQAVGAMYVRSHFDESSKTTAVEMVKDIQASFLELLEGMEWMDSVTKQRAFEKATAMKTLIGYPSELLVEENLRNLFNGLVLSSDNFFENLLNLTKGSTDYGMGKLKEPVDKNEWLQFGKPAMVNAFYQPIANSIQFPAGILQGHFFDNRRPSYMNYGAIGWVIGHEITHGFDDQGSHFDLNGNVRDWWNPITKRHFHEKARCLVDQYSSFTYQDPFQNITVPLNGIISLGENLADNGGIKQAYKGYQAWVKRNGQEKMLPGLKYTPNQLFWISAATNWCSKVRPQQMVESIQTGVHAPGEFRVRGTFANMEQFSKDFNCPVGSRMNPTQKCEVW